MLRSLEIKGFRAFRELTIPRLGRVNLIVGRNNVGKTTLLEALAVYAAGLNADREIRRLLERRKEVRVDAHGAAQGTLALGRIFHHAQSAEAEAPERKAFRIGPSNSSEPGLFAGYRTSAARVEKGDIVDEELPEPELLIEQGEHERAVPVSRIVRAATYADSIAEDDAAAGSASFLVTPSGLEDNDVARLWSRIVLTDPEDDVVAALQIIAPDVERVTVTTSPAGGHVSIYVRRKGMARRETLASLGDGMNRLFALALALAAARGGLLLVDEIENGLHYSVHASMWRFLSAAAERLDVQVFATTHSWDCIEGFQAAAMNDAVVLRLDRRQDDIFATLFDERDVAIATRGSIEVR